MTMAPARPGAGPALSTWTALGVSVELAVTDPAALPRAQAMLVEDLAALDLACSRFRSDSEVVRMSAASGAPVACSPLLRDVLRAALGVAATTDGALDPTVGGTLVDLGYDRDFAQLPPDVLSPRLAVHRRAHWSEVVMTDDTVTVPANIVLDLGATAKAWASDRSAARIATATGTGVLVSLGGDVAVAGPPPELGWAVQVQDKPGRLGVGPVQVVAIWSGGLATSSTTARRWQHGGRAMHHIVDPSTCRPAVSPWRTVSAVAPTCLEANTLTTTAIIRGQHGRRWLQSQGAPARLVSTHGHVTTLHGWPSPRAADGSA